MRVDEHEAWARLRGVRATVRDLRVAVRSADRSVTATVNADGELCDLRIDSGLAGRLSAEVLAATILGAARLGAAQAREHVRVALRDAVPEPLRQVVDDLTAR